ncbi:srg family chemoreceptor domain-containing protein [Ditylenchus destructor]|uniref:Serpentine receptor class gamma n=1 Tax=Ditylenchus destructor TaxID=166010 RepID=A0AAD4QX26_9BILA|nr:srg family chemoreceptor domain-containing protein [Ditylenchus destructor]
MTLVTTSYFEETVWWWSGMVKYRGGRAPLFFHVFDSWPTEHWALTLLFFFNYALLITSRTSNFLLTLNRFTVMQLSAHMYEKVWRYLLPISVVVMCIVAGVLNMPILLHGSYINPPTEEAYFFEFRPHDVAVEYRQSLYSIALIVAFAPAMLAMNMSIAYSLWRRRKAKLNKTFNQSTDRVRDAEAKLCILTFTMMVTYLAGLVCQLFFFVAGNGGFAMSSGMSQTLSTIQGFGEDVHILSEPWMLVFMSQGVRKVLINMVSCGKWSSNLVSSVNSHNTLTVKRLSVNPTTTNTANTVSTIRRNTVNPNSVEIQSPRMYRESF